MVINVLYLHDNLFNSIVHQNNINIFYLIYHK